MAETRTIQFVYETGCTNCTFCLQTVMSRISFFQILLDKFTFFSHLLFATYRNKYCQMKTVNGFTFQFATFSLQNITGLDAGLDGKIQTTVNIRFSQSNSRIWQFPVLVRQSHILNVNIMQQNYKHSQKKKKKMRKMEKKITIKK